MTDRGSTRAAIAGAGLMGYWHAASLARLGIRVTAVLDPNEDSARRILRIHPDAKVFRDAAAFMAECGAEVVHVCTPRELHAEQITSALRAGRNVLVEKPLAVTAAQTDTLLAEADSRQLKLCPVHQFPFQPGALELARRLPELGRIRHIDFSACSAGGAGRSADECAMIAADILPHPLSLLVHLLPREIYSQLAWHSVTTAAGEVRATATGNGTSVAILVSMAGRPTRNTMRVIGEEATAHLDLFHGYLVIEQGRVSRATKITQPFAHAVRTLTTAGANLVTRAARREPAYPGLRELIHRFHHAVLSRSTSPLTRDEISTVARLREELVA